MKLTIRTVAAFALLSVTLTGCQKEEQLPMQQMQLETAVSVYSVCYDVDGTIYRQAVVGEHALLDLMHYLTSLANEGYTIHVWNTESQNSGYATKETVTFTTRDRNEADEWSAMMVLDGYSVTMYYKNGEYTCIATKK